MFESNATPNASQKVRVFTPNISGINQFQRSMTGAAVTTAMTQVMAAAANPKTNQLITVSIFAHFGGYLLGLS